MLRLRWFSPAKATGGGWEPQTRPRLGSGPEALPAAADPARSAGFALLALAKVHEIAEAVDSPFDFKRVNRRALLRGFKNFRESLAHKRGRYFGLSFWLVEYLGYEQSCCVRLPVPVGLMEIATWPCSML